MNESIQQLTNKIYQEGVEKAEARVKEMLNDAAQKAREIVDEAELRAREIVENAEREAAQIKQRNEAEMRLSARQAIGALKQQISEVVTLQLNQESVRAAVHDVSFMRGIIGKLMDYWLTQFGREERLRILLPQEEYENYTKFLEERTNKIMESGISIAFSDHLNHGFQIVALDQGFKVSFTDLDFENYFSTFASPSVNKLLFGPDE